MLECEGPIHIFDFDSQVWSSIYHNDLLPILSVI